MSSGTGHQLVEASSLPALSIVWPAGFASQIPSAQTINTIRLRYGLFSAAGLASADLIRIGVEAAPAVPELIELKVRIIHLCFVHIHPLTI